MNYVCPVCGYNQLEGSPYDKDGGLSYEICSCCGCRYEFNHEERSKLQL